MSPCKKNGGETRKKGLTMLKLLIEKLQRNLSPPKSRSEFYELQAREEAAIPDDVKEGQFAVFASVGNETKRFVVELRFLSNPAFLSLLKQAEDEFGFEQTGALAVPCRPEVLQNILQAA